MESTRFLDPNVLFGIFVELLDRSFFMWDFRTLRGIHMERSLTGQTAKALESRVVFTSELVNH